MEYIRLGQIGKPFGISGQVRCFSLTDFAAERFAIGAKLSLLDPATGARRTATVSSFRDAGAFCFLGFEEIASIPEAKAVQGFFIEIDKSQAPLPDGYFRLEDLKGCAIIDQATGQNLGSVTDVLSYAPTKTLVVSRQGAKPFYVPFVMGEFIASLDLSAKRIAINVIPGLL
jgi:16S rRNA processing protein RimM